MFSRLGFGGGGPRSAKQDEDVLYPTPSNAAGPAKALRLVYCDEKGRFRMDAEAVAALQLVKGPIGVVSVCGRARQGKSFILNQLLGRSSGFQVGPTHRPCTKGLWMWSAPLKRVAPDGTEYSLLLLDSEGIDAYDQTGTYSTQIFSLAVLLSSMFIYNQMGGIDEAALDRLSLVTEMTKHIRVRSQNRTTADELGQFSPVFLWLLRDFYLDLKEDSRRITPRDYLESALQPMSGTGKAIYSKNEIRDSIRALFPDRHCFTLLRPVNEEHDLQRLDTIPIEKMRPEFRLGLDHLTKFVFERTRPKQLGSTVMTGPVLAGLTQSFLDALNAGAVPTIATSWQNVEENECRRAHEKAVEAYLQKFDKSTPADQVALQEAYEAALQNSLAVYSFEAVGAGPVRAKYEKLLQATLRKMFEDHKQKVSMEAELKCVKAVESMDEKLRAACHSPTATWDEVLNVLNELISNYERTVSGPAKWRKLVKFLQQSLEGPCSDLVKRVITHATSHVSTLELKSRSLEDKLSLMSRQIESAQRESLDWKRRYEAAMADYKSSTEHSAGQYTALQSKVSKLEEKRISLSQQLEAAMKEAYEWQNKFEHTISERRSEEERSTSEFASLQSRCSAAEARLAAAREQADSAKEEAAEWRRKHDSAVSDARSTAERFNSLRERGNKQSQQREDAIRSEFTTAIAQKDAALMEAHAKLEQSEHIVTDLKARLQGQETKLLAQEDELASIRTEKKHLQRSIESTKGSALSLQREAEIAKQEKFYAEEKMKNAVKKLEEVEGRFGLVEREAKRAAEEAERAKAAATAAEREKLEAMRLAMERLAGIEKAERHAESVARERDALLEDLQRARSVEQDSMSKIDSLEKRLEERKQEMEEVLEKSHEQRASTVHVLEGLLASERAAHAEAGARAEALSLQLQNVQGKLDSLQHELATVRLNETALETKLRTQAESSGRRKRSAEQDDSVHDMDFTPTKATAATGDHSRSRKKRARLDLNENGSSQGTGGGGGGGGGGGDGGGGGGGGGDSEDHGSTELRDSQDYRKFTIPILKQELTKAGYGAQILQMRTATKKDILALYEKVILNK